MQLQEDATNAFRNSQTFGRSERRETCVRVLLSKALKNMEKGSRNNRSGDTGMAEMSYWNGVSNYCDSYYSDQEQGTADIISNTPLKSVDQCILGPLSRQSRR